VRSIQRKQRPAAHYNNKSDHETEYRKKLNVIAYYTCLSANISVLPSIVFEARKPSARLCYEQKPNVNKFVRPTWPYDMRPSVRAEKYIRDAGP